MADSIDRRSFFSTGLRRALGHAVDAVSNKFAPGRYTRPPGALPEASFLAACTRCGECTAACPAHAIRPLGADAGFAAGTPALSVNVTACVMCTDMPCARACPTAALEVPSDLWKQVKLTSIAIDTERCIAYRDVECGVCARACPAGENALRIDYARHPVLGPDCTGCGVCIQACVTSPSSIKSSIIGRPS
jgi:ferredoxin-type protein NapG